MKATIEELLQYFKGALDAASDAIGMSTSEGKHWYQNTAFDNLFGDIGQDPPSSVYADEQMGRKIFETIMAGGEWSGEVLMKGKDGNLLNIFLRAYPIRTGNGDVVGIVGVHTDITQKKQDREVLHLQHDLCVALSGATNLEEALSLIVNAACEIPDLDCGGVYLVNQDTKALNLFYSKGLSPQFVKKISQYGKDSDQAKMIASGKTIFADYSQLKISRDPVKQKEKIRAIVIIPIFHRSEAIGALNVASHTTNRITLHTRKHLETMASQVGSAIARVIAEEENLKQNRELQLLSNKLRKEIDEHKRAEKTLEVEKERFRILTEKAPLGISMIGEDGRYRYLNPKFIEMFGYNLEDVPTGKDWFKQAYPNKEYRHEVISTWINDLKEFKVGESRPRTFTVTCKNGLEKIIYFKPVTLETGDQFMICEDVTNQEYLENQLRQAQKMEAIGTLAGGIAHDFNNILFPIVGLSELIAEDLPTGSPEHKNVQEILKAAKRGSDLVKQILALSRQSEHKLMPVRLQKILQEASRLGRSTIPSDIKIKQDIQNDCGLVMADPTQLHQVTMNLITNAYHAVESTGGEISLQLKEIELKGDDLEGLSIEPGQYALMTIIDSGCGIEPAVMDKIFLPYFTTKEQGKGTGLGLAVAYGIVKKHIGDIKVYSEVGKGTTINVYLPLMEKSDETVSVEKVQDYETGNERILLVDDEAPIAQVERKMLERLGYQVTSRTSSPDALEAFSAHPDFYDLVITDMTMPNITGDKLSKELISIRPDIPVIICTGFSERINDEKAKAIGIKGFLMKPIVMSEMSHLVRKVIDEAKKGSTQ
jgi:PAS domain S-box-containing protein